MKYFDWDKDKNELLKKSRNISFEQIISAITNGDLLSIEKNSKAKYVDQKLFIVKIDEYIFVVPFVEDEEKYFLKTIYPSRKYTRDLILKIILNFKLMKYFYDLDPEEKEIEDAIERGEFVSVDNLEEELIKLKEVAVNTLERNKNINIRIPAKVLYKLKAMAIEEGLPYQTLVSSVLHKYVTGKIK